MSQQKDQFGNNLPERPQNHRAHSGKDGCDLCNHPLYAGIKCGNCGRKTQSTRRKKK